jgi:hypothetical protein
VEGVEFQDPVELVCALTVIMLASLTQFILHSLLYVHDDHVSRLLLALFPSVYPLPASQLSL